MCHQGGRKKPGASSRRLGPRLGPCLGALGTGTGGPAGWKAPCTACSCWELLRARPEHAPVCGALRLVSATRCVSPTGNPGVCVLPEVTPPRPCADGGLGGGCGLCFLPSWPVEKGEQISRGVRARRGRCFKIFVCILVQFFSDYKNDICTKFG